MPPRNRPGVAALFDQLAPAYDQGGVAWFRPIAERLIELLAPQPGENALDIGAGRGAVAFPLSRAVGPTGKVTALDVSPRMTELLRSDADRLGRTNITTVAGHVADAALATGSFDVVAASLVLFFCPDPASELTEWLRTVRAGGGRLGITTFGGRSAAWQAADRAFKPFLPPGMLDARTSGETGPFASPAALATLFERCGAVAVETVEEPLVVRLPDVQAYQLWSMTLGQRAMWEAVPAEELPALLESMEAILAETRDANGMLRLTQQVRYTLAQRAA